MKRKVSTRIPTQDGTFTVHLYHSSRHPDKEHLAFVYGDISKGVVSDFSLISLMCLFVCLFVCLLLTELLLSFIIECHGASSQ